MSFGPKPRPIADRFWPKVIKAEGCWDWKGNKHPFGYGLLGARIDGKKRCLGAHVVSWFVHHGYFPKKGISVLHRCDVPACTRPDHLFLGTQRDNMLDMVRKGRWAKSHDVDCRGVNNSAVKLTEEQVRQIRVDFESASDRNCGAQRRLARQFGVHKSCIYLITTRKKWKHVV